MKRHFFSSVAIGVSFTASSAIADDYIRLGSWNIEHFGSSITSQHPKAIAEHIQLSGVDILALEEIYDTDGDPDTRTNAKLDQVTALMNENPAKGWMYRLFPNKQANDKSQLCGVAWDSKSLTLEGEPFKIPVDTDHETFNLWDRHPHAVKFQAGSGKTDFVLIVLHMKSNVDGVDFGRDQRAVEAERLIEQIDSVKEHFADGDIIIAGDTNCLHGDEKAVKEYVEAGFRDLNAADRATFVNTASPFDRIFVPKKQNEVKFSRQYVLMAADADVHESQLSDHYLVLTPIKILADDDN